jgi:hypothetical protein
MLGVKILGVGALSAVVGLTFRLSADRIRETAVVPETPASRVSQLNSQIRTRDAAAEAFLGAAAVSLLSGAALVIWPEAHQLSVTVSPSGGGALVAYGGTI